MNKILIIVAVVIAFLQFGATAQKANKQSKVESNISVLNKKFDQKADSVFTVLNQKIETELALIEEQKFYINELKEELVMYKAKEDYFADALSEQSNRFIFYASMLFALALLTAGVAGWGYWKLQLKEVRKEIQEFRDEFEQLRNEHASTNKTLAKTTANNYLAIAGSYAEKQSYFKSFVFIMLGACWGANGEEKNKTRQYEATLPYLTLALKHLKLIDKSTLDELTLVEEGEEMFKALDELSVLQNKAIKDTCAQIRIYYNTLIEEQKSSKISQN